MIKIIEKMVCVKFHTKIMIFDRVRVKKRAKFGSRPYMGIRFSSITQSFFAQFQQNCIWILRRPISIILQSFMSLAQKIKISIRARVCRDCRRQKVPIDFKLSQIAIQSIIYLCNDFQWYWAILSLFLETSYMLGFRAYCENANFAITHDP